MIICFNFWTKNLSKRTPSTIFIPLVLLLFWYKSFTGFTELNFNTATFYQYGKIYDPCKFYRSQEFDYLFYKCRGVLRLIWTKIKISNDFVLEKTDALLLLLKLSRNNVSLESIKVWNYFFSHSLKTHK